MKTETALWAAVTVLFNVSMVLAALVIIMALQLEDAATLDMRFIR